jgi:hypothetical protein
MEKLPSVRDSIKSEVPYFSGTLKWTVLVVSLAVIGYLIYRSNYYSLTGILILINLILFSSKYQLLFDLNNKIIIDSFQVIWITIRSEKIKFNKLHCVRFDKVKHGYAARSRARDREVDFKEYIGTLEFDDNSLELSRSFEYEEISKAMKMISSQLNIPVQRTF